MLAVEHLHNPKTNQAKKTRKESSWFKIKI
uniref:Uncharacterized protein n=1 Tax=Anguilla anguilla TaxID=7936 RepID=A0A0E9PQY1_ANGAN